MRLWYLFDFVFLWRNFAGRKVASRKDDLREIVEHFNVRILRTQKSDFHFHFSFLMG